jgi:protease-4
MNRTFVGLRSRLAHDHRRAFVASALLLAGLFGCEGRPRAPSAKAEGSNSEPNAGPSIAILDLSDGVPERAEGGLLGLSAKIASFSDLVAQVELLDRSDAAAEHSDVRGVLVRLGSTRIGLARAAEIGSMLADLGAKVPVWCHADEFANDTLALAARGCKRVWISPASSVDSVGLAMQTIYFHKLLAGEIGLDIDFLQVGKFKGAEEPFTRDGPSPEARQSLESTLADLRGAWLDGFRKGRPSAPESAMEDGPYTPEGAKDRGLVDDVGYFDQARSALETEAGAVRSDIRLGTGSQSVGGDALVDLLRSVAGDSLGTAPVALVEATGAISMDGGGGLFGDGGGILERRLIRTLIRLERDDDVKAVVLRIDSPGGSALASDLLWHELMTIRHKKTLVVSIGDMAASGGYYLASSGAVVFADATSIVGSIGVVGGKIAIDRALEKVGVHAETFTGKAGDQGAASRAGSDSLLIPWDDATRDRVLETMTGIYRLFLSRVAEGRNLPIERVAASAEGRIFSGRDGKSRGLVDEIGGLREAIVRAREMAGLPPDARIEAVGETSGLLRTLAENDAQGRAPGGLAANARRTQSGAPGALETLLRTQWERATGDAPELVPFAASLAPLASGEHALCALPFALTVR